MDDKIGARLTPTALKPLAVVIGVGLVALLLALALVQSDSHSDSSSRASLAELKEGNERWAEGKAKHPDQSTRRRAAVAKAQAPRAVVVTCADSRVAPELVFDCGLGDLFVVRTAGGVLDYAGQAAIDLAIDQLHVPLVVVMGHTGCAAVQSAVEAVDRPITDSPAVAALAANLRPAVDFAKAQTGDPVNEAVAAQVHLSLRAIQESSGPAGRAVRAAEVRLAGGIYDLQTGQVEWLR